MHLDQAVYTSATTSRARGYQLVSRSSGVTTKLGQELVRWSPSHDSLLDSDSQASCINFHGLDNGLFAVSRSFYGGPEYSRRGGLRVVTNTLIVSGEQLSGYDHNPLMFARVLIALGHLRLRSRYPATLPTIEAPTNWLTASLPPTCRQDSAYDSVVDVLRQERVALVSPRPALQAIDGVLSLLNPEQRLATSFSSGLRPARQRPYRLHVLPDADVRTRKKLSVAGINQVLEVV